MIPQIALQEFSLALVAAKHNPAFLTKEFLTGSGVVPDDWTVARFVVADPQTVQLAFTNGLSLVAKPHSLVFSEPLLHPTLGERALADVQTPAAARRYADALPQLDYQAVSFTLRSFLTFASETTEDSEAAARHYIRTRFLAPGAWLAWGDELTGAALQLSYRRGEQAVNLSVEPVQLQLPGQAAATTAVLVVGNLPQVLSTTMSAMKLAALYPLLADWQPAVEWYRELLAGVLGA